MKSQVLQTGCRVNLKLITLGSERVNPSSSLIQPDFCPDSGRSNGVALCVKDLLSDEEIIL